MTTVRKKSETGDNSSWIKYHSIQHAIANALMLDEPHPALSLAD